MVWKRSLLQEGMAAGNVHSPTFKDFTGCSVNSSHPPSVIVVLSLYRDQLMAEVGGLREKVETLESRYSSLIFKSSALCGYIVQDLKFYIKKGVT